MNIANKITLSRLFMAVIFVALMSSGLRFYSTAALIIFITAAVTDYYDGKLARKYGIITIFGELIDPLVDKILTCAAFIAFLQIPFLKIPAWTVIIIISREFAVTGLRLLAASKGRIIPAVREGKQKTILQLTTIIVILLYMSVRELHFLPETADLYFAPCALLLIIITAIITVYSGLKYLIINRELLLSGNI